MAAVVQTGSRPLSPPRSRDGARPPGACFVPSSRAALIYQHATTERDRAIADALSKLAARGTGTEDQGDDDDPPGHREVAR